MPSLRSAPAFFTDGPTGDPVYLSHRDHNSKTDVRERIEGWWQRYAPYCPDRHFLLEARKQFVARTWEMYLACTLLQAGFKLEKPPAKGPDILVRIGEHRLWIEAVAPRSGDGPDAVPGRDARGNREGNVWQGHSPAEEVLLLRCTSAIREKAGKHALYVADGVIAPDDAFVIAVSLAAIEDADLSSPELPLILKAVFPIGRGYWSVPVGDDNGDEHEGFLQRGEITKKSGEVVTTTFFTSKDSAPISGLLYTNTGVWNAPQDSGSDITVVTNPMAGVPLPGGIFPFVREEILPDPANPHGAMIRRPRQIRV